MKNIVTAGEDYIKNMDIMDIGFIKVCMFSAGLFSGICIPKKKKTKVGFIAFFVYLVTLIVLMSKFLRLYKEQE